jgi:adenylyl-sulfate kinase
MVGNMTAQPGFTLWLTGLPCSGKSTLASLVAEDLRARSLETEILDGDAVRANLSKGLGFSKEDRDENIRRIGFVCGLLSRHGIIAIAAAISPYRATRNEVRASIPNFFEVYVKASLEVCARRDTRGMYRKALAGEIQHFTGLDDPYEPPLRPELVISTEAVTPHESAVRILEALGIRGLLAPRSSHGHSSENASQMHATVEGMPPLVLPH